MLHRTAKLQLAEDGSNKAFSSFDLYDHADRTSFSKLRNCFVLTHSNNFEFCRGKNCIKKIMCIQPVVLCNKTQEQTLSSSIDLFLGR